MTMNATIHLAGDVEVHYGATDIGGYVTIENATPGNREAVTVHGTNAQLRDVAASILAAVPASESVETVRVGIALGYGGDPCGDLDTRDEVPYPDWMEANEAGEVPA